MTTVQHPVLAVTEAAIETMGFSGAFGITFRSLCSFLEKVDLNYNCNPYHNSVYFNFSTSNFSASCSRYSADSVLFFA